MTVQTFYKQEDDRIIVTRAQNVGAIVDRAKALSNEGFHGRPDARVVASIPPVVIEHYCNVKGITFQQWCTDPEIRKKFLNDPDYADLRIWKGKV
ncbi:MAG: hypothetical protein ING37_02290 [Rhodocyclaceae bacterium]|jgi:hypothetical protein|nr:hypothetical protein [Rhodocyclaceae bacterium]